RSSDLLIFFSNSAGKTTSGRVTRRLQLEKCFTIHRFSFKRVAPKGSRILPLKRDAQSTRPLFDLDNLIGNQAMCFPMNSDCSFFIRGFNETKYLTGVLVKPVAQVLDAALLLRLHMGFMGVGNGIGG